MKQKKLNWKETITSQQQKHNNNKKLRIYKNQWIMTKLIFICTLHLFLCHIIKQQNWIDCCLPVASFSYVMKSLVWWFFFLKISNCNKNIVEKQFQQQQQQQNKIFIESYSSWMNEWMDVIWFLWNCKHKYHSHRISSSKSKVNSFQRFVYLVVNRDRLSVWIIIPLNKYE